MIEIEWARKFANEWVTAWNDADLERILAHYANDFEMTSPLIVERMGVASGTLKGKDAIRPYWSQGVALRPPAHFELIDVLAGVNSVAIYYRSVTRSKLAVERFEFNSQRQVIRSEALYRTAETSN
jgi:ketosteroid isomerase-like protein